MAKLHVSCQSNSVRSNHQQHSWSKSETNLCGKPVGLNNVPSGCCGGGGGSSVVESGVFKLSVFGVVSLNDLQETVESPFQNVGGRPMNDLSKYHPTLNNISNDEICTKTKSNSLADD